MVILSLYQDYPWKIIAKQPIDRRFVVEGQIGEAVFYVNEKERRAIAYVSKEQDLSKIKIKELKLGPTGSTIHGYDGNATVMNFTGGQPQIVIVTYREYTGRLDTQCVRNRCCQDNIGRRLGQCSLAVWRGA